MPVREAVVVDRSDDGALRGQGVLVGKGELLVLDYYRGGDACIARRVVDVLEAVALGLVQTVEEGLLKSALVPELTITAYSTPRNSAASLSNLST